MPHMTMIAHRFMLAAVIWPGLFAAGAACATIPIIIHLLTRRRYRRIRWAAIEFLLDAQRRNQRRLRMEELVLLALRCLALLGLALVVARFFVRPNGQGAGLGRVARVEHILLIDDSMSMSYELDERQRVFDVARTGATRLLDNMITAGSDDAITLFRMTQSKEPLAAGVACTEDGLSQVRAQITALQQTQRTFVTADVIQNIRDYLDGHPDILSAVLYVISDFQAKDWVEGATNRERDTAPPAGEGAEKPTGAMTAPGKGDLASALIGWTTGQKRELRIVLVNVAAANPANLAVSDVQLSGALPVVAAPSRVEAAVANFGTNSADHVELTASAGALVSAPQVLSRLAPGQVGRVGFDVTFPSAGDEAIRVALPDDRLDADNAAYAVAEVMNAVRVLVVDGEPSSDAFADETHLLSAALRPEGELFSGNEVTTITSDALAGTPLDPFHLVILANVDRVSSDVADTLYRYATAGGGIVIFLGDQVDADDYNTVLGAAGHELLPARLTDVMHADDQPLHLVIRNALHPVLSGLAREGDPLGLGLVRVRRFVACESPSPDAERGATATGASPSDVSGAAGDPLAWPDMRSSGARVSVPATFDDAAQSPAVLERRVGAGKVVMFTSSADKEWNSWADSPTYVPTMLELATYVARRSARPPSTLVGERLSLTVDAEEFEPNAFVRTPGYPTETEIFVSAAPESDARNMRFSLNDPRTTGVYAFILHTRQDREVVKLMAVNVDDREGDLTAARKEELSRAFTGLPVEILTGVDHFERLASEGRREWWPALTAAVVALLMMEQFLAWRFGRRGQDARLSVAIGPARQARQGQPSARAGPTEQHQTQTHAARHAREGGRA